MMRKLGRFVMFLRAELYYIDFEETDSFRSAAHLHVNNGKNDVLSYPTAVIGWW